MVYVIWGLTYILLGFSVRVFTPNIIGLIFMVIIAVTTANPWLEFLQRTL